MAAFNTVGVWETWLAPGGREDFSFAERLAIGALRMRLAGEAPWCMAVRVVIRSFGVSTGEAVAADLDRLFAALDHGARRDFMIYPPACDKVSADERALLTALAAYQHGDDAWAGNVVQWLVRPAWQAPACESCREAAHAFARRQLRLHLKARGSVDENCGTDWRPLRAG